MQIEPTPSPPQERLSEVKNNIMRILKYGGKLVQEIGFTTDVKVVFLRYLKQEDMPKCKCGEPIDKEISIVEDCKIWKEEITGVDTL